MRLSTFLLPLASLLSLNTAHRFNPDECQFEDYPTDTEIQACNNARDRHTKEAMAKVATMQPLIGKKLLVPDYQAEQRQDPLLDWRALMPSLEYWLQRLQLWTPKEYETLTLEDFPEEVDLRHCCYVGGDRNSCIFTCDYVTSRYVTLFKPYEMMKAMSGLD